MYILKTISEVAFKLFSLICHKFSSLQATSYDKINHIPLGAGFKKIRKKIYFVSRTVIASPICWILSFLYLPIMKCVKVTSGALKYLHNCQK